MGLADAALLLCGVPPKSHGVDDRSPGQTRRSAQKLEKLDGKPGRITNFGAGPIGSTAVRATKKSVIPITCRDELLNSA